MNPLEFFIVFLKASLFSTGGFGNLPSLHQDLTGSGMAVDADFSRAIAVGQISPGPNGLWAVALGFFSFGIAGAFLALLAISLPSLTVLGLEAIHNRFQHLSWVRGFIRSISVAVIGLLALVIFSLVSGPEKDWRSFLFTPGAALLAWTNRINAIVILLLAGLGGFLVFSL